MTSRGLQVRALTGGHPLPGAPLLRLARPLTYLRATSEDSLVLSLLECRLEGDRGDQGDFLFRVNHL